MTTSTHVAATANIEFDPGDRPTVRCADGGILHGCTATLDALYLTVTVGAAADGSPTVNVHTSPVVHRLLHNPDDRDRSAIRAAFTITADQIPEQAQPTLRELVRAVHMLHPALRLEDAA